MSGVALLLTTYPTAILIRPGRIEFDLFVQFDLPDLGSLAIIDHDAVLCHIAVGRFGFDDDLISPGFYIRDLIGAIYNGGSEGISGGLGPCADSTLGGCYRSFYGADL